jgi:hypothetical protein
MGEKEPLDSEAVTHSICPECKAKELIKIHTQEHGRGIITLHAKLPE